MQGPMGPCRLKDLSAGLPESAGGGETYGWLNDLLRPSTIDYILEHG